ncbi:YbaK/EbsC family protein [Nostocoides australiense]
MSPDLTTHPAVTAVRAALAERGLDPEFRVLPDAVKTAQAAADALGITPAEIANSLIFKAIDADGSVSPLLVMASGGHRVDTGFLAGQLGIATLERADPDFVRSATGMAIGGVAPVGHPTPVRTVVDRVLERFDQVWAAGGHAHAVFRTSYADLLAMTGGAAADVVAPTGPGVGAAGARHPRKRVMRPRTPRPPRPTARSRRAGGRSWSNGPWPCGPRRSGPASHRCGAPACGRRRRVRAPTSTDGRKARCRHPRAPGDEAALLEGVDVIDAHIACARVHHEDLPRRADSLTRICLQQIVIPVPLRLPRRFRDQVEDHLGGSGDNLLGADHLRLSHQSSMPRTRPSIGIRAGQRAGSRMGSSGSGRPGR